MTKQTTKVKVTLSPAQIRAVKAFSNAKRAIDAATARKIRAEAVIREALGDVAEIGVTPDNLAIVSLQHSTNSSYDSTVLKLRFPLAEAAAKKTTPYTYIKTV